LLAQVSNGELSLGGIFDRFKVNIDSYANTIKKFNELDLGLPEFKKDDEYNWDAITKAIGECDQTALSYFKTLDDGNGTINNQSASVEGLSAHLKATGQSFNFAAVKATLLNTALNAGIFLIASLAIQGIAKALDNYIHRVEKARERTSELFDEFKEMNDTLADHKKTVAELASRYDELSKGVNLSTNDNLSLSTEEYEEFLNINEQLANSFPELAKGIDENGNSILTLGTKGITAKEQLEELLQTEEDLNNFRIAEGLNDAFEGVYTYIEEANEATNKLSGSISDSSMAMSKLQDVAENGIKLSSENQLIFSGNINNQAELDYMDALTASVNEFWKSLDGSRIAELDSFGINNENLFNFNRDDNTGAFEVYSNVYNLTPEELTVLENIIQDNVEDVSGALLDSISTQSQKLQEKVQQGENAWRDFIPNLVSGMKSKQTFKDLDSDLQDIAVQIVEGLDYSFATAMNEWNPDDPYAYIRDNLIVPMGDLSDDNKKKLQSSFEDLFKLDAGNISQSNQEEISNLINIIADLLEKDPLELRIALGFDVEDIQNRYNEALKEAKRQLGGYGHDDRGFEVNNDIGNKLDDFWNKNVVTEEDWTLWKQVTDGITDATKAMNAFTEAKKNANAVKADESSTLSISDTIDQLNTQLKPAFDSLKSAYQDIFTDDGFTLENVDLSMLDSIKSSIDDLNSLEGVDINIDYSSFENLAKVLTDTTSTADDVHEAMDTFATDIVSALNPAISECSGEAYLMVQSLLESVGVMNSEEVMVSSLGYTYEEYIAAKKECADAGFDLANATEDEINGFIQEQGGAENCGVALATLQLKKLLVNSTYISTVSDVNQILSLANAANISANSLIALANAKAQFETAQAKGDKLGMSLAARGMKETSQKVKEDILNFEPVSVDFAPKGGSSKGSKGDKDTTKEFDWIENAIQSIEDEIGRLDKIANSSYSSISEKNEALIAQIGKINEEIALQQQAYERYMSKADSIGLSDEYKNLIQNGALNIEEITDKDLQEAIANYTEWYEKAKETQDKINDLYDNAKDKHVAAYELEAGEIQKLRESQAITEREYLDAMLALYEKYYAAN